MRSKVDRGEMAAECLAPHAPVAVALFSARDSATIAGMQRRTFLKRGLLGGAVLAVGGVGALAAYPSRVKYAPTEPLRVLNPRTFNIMASVAARVVTAEGADP